MTLFDNVQVKGGRSSEYMQAYAFKILNLDYLVNHDKRACNKKEKADKLLHDYREKISKINEECASY